MNSLSRFYLFCVNLIPYSVFLLLTSSRSNTFDCTGWVYLNPMCIRNVWLVHSVQCSVYNIYVTGIAPIGIQLRFILRSECLAILFLIYYLERSYSLIFSSQKEAACEWFVVSGEGVQPDTRSKTGSRYFGNIRWFLQERPSTRLRRRMTSPEISFCSYFFNNDVFLLHGRRH